VGQDENLVPNGDDGSLAAAFLFGRSLPQLDSAQRVGVACAHCSFAYSALASFRMGMSGRGPALVAGGDVVSRDPVPSGYKFPVILGDYFLGNSP
jgi:hypothetical protein